MMCPCGGMCTQAEEACRSQKRPLDDPELRSQAVVSRMTGCWELNLGPPKELFVCLAVKPSLQVSLKLL